MPSEFERVERLFKQLCRATPQAFPAARESLDVPERHGVYVILGTRGAPVMHVGRTVTGKRGLKQRLFNHLHGRSSFVIDQFGGKGAELRGRFSFKYVVVPIPRTRALLERVRNR
jgi:hypothetical protein